MFYVVKPTQSWRENRRIGCAHLDSAVYALRCSSPRVTPTWGGRRCPSKILKRAPEGNQDSDENITAFLILKTYDECLRYFHMGFHPPPLGALHQAGQRKMSLMKNNETCHLIWNGKKSI